MRNVQLPERYAAPLMIAEIGGNHEGDFEYAKKLLNDAVEAGAHAVKFQTYSADGLVNPRLDSARHKHFGKFSLPIEQFKELAMLSQNRGVLFMSSLWDTVSLEELDPFIQIHKVGSGDLTNFPLLELIALKNKPLLLSTAMATMDDIVRAVEFIREVNPRLIEERKFCLLHCVAMYGDPQHSFAHLLAIKVLQERFPDLKIGYSDHTIGNSACQVALALGANILEFHFTDDKSREFRDHHISLDKADLQNLLVRAREITELLGQQDKEPVAAVETPARIREFRRGLYLARDMRAGERIEAQDLVTLRPFTGIDPRDYRSLIGKQLLRDVEKFETLEWGFFRD